MTTTTLRLCRDRREVRAVSRLQEAQRSQVQVWAGLIRADICELGAQLATGATRERLQAEADLAEAQWRREGFGGGLQ